MALNIDFHPDPYREIRNRALSARISLDTPARPDLRHSDKLADHISDCLINPTRGLIASRDYLNAENVNYPKYYGRNLHLMKKQCYFFPLEFELPSKHRILAICVRFWLIVKKV